MKESEEVVVGIAAAAAGAGAIAVAKKKAHKKSTTGDTEEVNDYEAGKKEEKEDSSELKKASTVFVAAAVQQAQLPLPLPARKRGRPNQKRIATTTTTTSSNTSPPAYYSNVEEVNEAHSSTGGDGKRPKLNAAVLLADKKTTAVPPILSRVCPHCSKRFIAVNGLQYHVEHYVCRPLERPGVMVGRPVKDDGRLSYTTHNSDSDHHPGGPKHEVDNNDAMMRANVEMRPDSCDDHDEQEVVKEPSFVVCQTKKAAVVQKVPPPPFVWSTVCSITSTTVSVVELLWNDPGWWDPPRLLLVLAIRVVVAIRAWSPPMVSTIVAVRLQELYYQKFALEPFFLFIV